MWNLLVKDNEAHLAQSAAISDSLVEGKVLEFPNNIRNLDWREIYSLGNDKDIFSFIANKLIITFDIFI